MRVMVMIETERPVDLLELAKALQMAEICKEASKTLKVGIKSYLPTHDDVCALMGIDSLTCQCQKCKRVRPTGRKGGE